MKTCVTFLFLSIASIVFSQEQEEVFTLCGIELSVPIGCVADQHSQVQCEDYTLTWLYMTPEMFEQELPEHFIKQMGEQLNNFKLAPITASMFDQPATAYKIRFKKKKGYGYQLVAYAIINQQPVLLQLVLNKPINSNKDIPETARRVLQFIE